ncbi:family 20 glycosylhydrolase [Carboxylicivirga sediminis]|uniref:beta-N-acetylhexosaminidase n=1 Tax=Carboxylicivirga sediminis TaxID=2006564 RepID=A0A941F7Q6_9BACT|nr:family 20 glycosylhydrolase [Carboxylicivirga sediminis]MBR8537338.1 family 20 glycosylhydrolase [Carboxylicivirga sediminis]
MSKTLFTLSLILLLIGCQNSTIVDKYAIIPQPNSISYNDDFLSINHGIAIESNYPDGMELIELLKKQSNKPGLTFDSQGATPFLLVYNPDLDEEAYQLQIKTDRIVIYSSSKAGWINGYQSFLQMWPVGEYDNIQIRCGEINDMPRFAYRGLHLDVSRHFFTLDEVKALVDQMVYYKLNKLHLHLTDDQGWRIEIEKYPLLTENGAWREHNNQDSLCLERSIDDATFAIPDHYYAIKEGKKLYGGFYTKADLKHLIDYCAQRNIEIIPEIDVPGHFKAAIENYPHLSCTGKAGWGAHFSYPACLGKASTYTFIEDVLTEVAELFPSEYIHIGGDEVNKDEWKKCPSCQAAIKKLKLKDEHELQSHFNHEIEDFLASKGKKLLGWDEIVEGGLSDNATVMWWRNWAPNTIRDAAKGGNDIIVTPDFEYYFDFPYSATPTSKVYNFEPVPDDFTVDMANRIIGVQGNVWTERIPNTKRLAYQVLPRMLAMAESGWTNQELKNFEAFEERLKSHYTYFESQGLFYHLPEITGFEDKTVFTNVSSFQLTIPDSEIEVYYTLDGTAPDRQSIKYTGAIEIDKSCTIRFRAYKGKVFSKIYSADYIKQSPAQPVVVDAKSGLKRRFYKGRYWKSKDVPVGKSADAEVVVADFGLGQYDGQENYALVFDGYFKASFDGVYTFYTKSDDGDQLFIHEQLVVDNDPSHGPRGRKGAIALKAGLHPLRLIYCQIGGGALQEVYVQVPGQKKRKVTSDELFN